MNKKLWIVILIVVIVLIVGIVMFLRGRDNNVPVIIDNPPSTQTGEQTGEVKDASKESKVITLTSANYEEEVLNSEKTVVIEFGATWCEDCKIQDPIIDEVSVEYENVKIARVDTDAESELKEYFGINAIPTIAIIKDGKITRKVVGIVKKDKLIDLINK